MNRLGRVTPDRKRRPQISLKAISEVDLADLGVDGDIPKETARWKELAEPKSSNEVASASSSSSESDLPNLAIINIAPDHNNSPPPISHPSPSAVPLQDIDKSLAHSMESVGVIEVHIS
jgi:hypothetical protein